MKVRKADVKIEVKVTAEHILKGQPRNARNCPIALALKDMGYQNVSCGLMVARADKLLYMLPAAAMHFVPLFDDWRLRDRAKPFEFVLDEVCDD